MRLSAFARPAFAPVWRWMSSSRRGSASRPSRADILFYASSWIDETWIRSTIFQCHVDRLRVTLLVSGEPPQPDPPPLAAYRRHGIPVVFEREPERLRGFQASVFVSASNGLPRALFSDRIGCRVHMPHSIVSLHMIYTADSFDGFDVLFAVGPHHVEEFNRLSTLRALPGRRAFPVGYGKLDLLLADHGRRPTPPAGRRRVLLAPSWGPSNVLRTLGPDVVGALLREDCDVVLRPHPLMLLGNEPALDALRRTFETHERFSIESPFAGDDTIFSAALMVTDYSGTAMEFALLRRRPCVFVDVPKKVVNPAWEDIGVSPVEVDFRPRLGVVVPPDVNALAHAVRAMLNAGDSQSDAIAAAGRDLVYHPGRCAQVAAGYLTTLVAEAQR